MKVSTTCSTVEGTSISLDFQNPLTESWTAHLHVDSDQVFVPSLSYKPENSRFEAVISQDKVSVKLKRLTNAGFLRNLGLRVDVGFKYVTLALGRKWKQGNVSMELETNLKWSGRVNYGVNLNLKGYRVNLPIEMPLLLPGIAVGAVIVPQFGVLLGSTLLDAFIQGVWNRQASFFVSSQSKEEILVAAEEARCAVELMRHSVERIIEEERARGGLVVIEAWYGSFGGQETDPELPLRIDVTLPVQFLVQDSKLKFTSRESKSVLDGFYDPCVGQRKQLWVRYQFKGNSDHTFLVDDQQSFSAPRPSRITPFWHLLETHLI